MTRFDTLNLEGLVIKKQGKEEVIDEAKLKQLIYKAAIEDVRGVILLIQMRIVSLG